MAREQDPAAVLTGAPLPRAFFARDALQVAPELLGCVVERTTPEGTVAVRLTEVEAYEGAADPASHAYRGRTRRNAVMFGDPGHVYVYFTYGMHWCANLVCGGPGVASAVLLRAGEVVAGVELARSRRPAARREADLAGGPARLAACLALTGGDDGTDVCSGTALRLRARAVPPAEVRWGPRVGVAGAGATFPWRCWLPGEPTVSAYRPAKARARRPAAAQ